MWQISEKREHPTHNDESDTQWQTEEEIDFMRNVKSPRENFGEHEIVWEWTTRDEKLSQSCEIVVIKIFLSLEKVS